MKIVILAGGLGTRISEESHLRPKPMIEIGGLPILWHIMKTYSHYGFNEFIICAGYKQNYIKDFFANYYLNNTDVTFDFSQGQRMTEHVSKREAWKVTVVDTGLNTMTGGRIRRIKEYIGNETFMLTYGDGVANVNIKELLEFHYSKKKQATLTAVKPEGRFGFLEINTDIVKSFREKDQQDIGFINGGFMVLEPSVIDLIQDDLTIFEKEPLERLAESNELAAYKHLGFWQCMDTLRDKEKLENLWANNKAPWKIWDGEYDE